MCIGVGRSGTTWIYKLLDSHKDISMALGKETNYFNNFYRTHSIEWYHKQFSTKKNYKIFGEVSNNYYFNEGIAERIFKYNPKTKLIFCIREPLDLLLTIKSFADRRSLKFHSVEDFLQTPIVNIMGQAIPNSEESRDATTVFQSLFFDSYLINFLKFFPKENIYLFKYEDLKENSKVSSENLLNFLGLRHTQETLLNLGKVNVRVRSRVPFIGFIASLVAQALRLMRMYSLLGKLKRSKIIYRILFTKSIDNDFRMELNNYFNHNSDMKQKITSSYFNACSIDSG